MTDGFGLQTSLEVNADSDKGQRCDEVRKRQRKHKKSCNGIKYLKKFSYRNIILPNQDK